MTNNILQKEYITTKYLIVVWTSGCWKYVSKTYGCNYGFNYSIKINKAIKFNNEIAAMNFIEHNNFDNKKYNIVKLECNYSVNFEIE